MRWGGTFEIQNGHRTVAALNNAIGSAGNAFIICDETNVLLDGDFGAPLDLLGGSQHPTPTPTHTHSLIHHSPITHSPTHLRAYSITNTLNHPPTSSTHPPTHSHPHPPTPPPAHPPIHPLTNSFTTHLLNQPLTHPHPHPHTNTHTHTRARSSADHSTAIDLSKSPAPGNIPHTHDASAAAAATECKYDNWWCFPNLLDHQHA